MPDISIELHPPRDWQVFEDFCCDLARAEWAVSAQRYGNPGQKQKGVDVFASTDGGRIGIQCKKKSRHSGARLTESEIKAECRKARALKPALTRLVLATTLAAHGTTVRIELLAGPIQKGGFDFVAPHSQPLQAFWWAPLPRHLLQGVAPAELAQATATNACAALPRLASLLRGASLVLGGDTGPIHLAHALGAPVLCVMGPTDPERHGPYGAPDRALAVVLPCSYCDTPLELSSRGPDSVRFSVLVAEQPAQ